MFADDSILAIPLNKIKDVEDVFKNFSRKYGTQINKKKTEIGIPCKKLDLKWTFSILQTLQRWRFLGF